MNEFSCRLYTLIKQFINRSISIEEFCNKYYIIYNLETDFDQLSKLENKLYDQMDEVVSRYSPYEDEREKYPNVYTNEFEIRRKASEIFHILDSQILRSRDKE